MARERWDAIVVGAGAMGTATAWHLARRGRAVLLLERSTIGHDRGSSHGPTRIFRLSYHHPDYVRMARRALEEWRALEAAAGERLLHRTGGLEAGPGARRNADALAAAGAPSAWLGAPEVEERWPGIRVPDGAEVLFQPDAGVVLADRTVRAQARAATALGASLPLRVTQEQVHYVLEGVGGPVPSLIEWTDPPDAPAYLVPDPHAPGVVKVAEHLARAKTTADSRS